MSKEERRRKQFIADCLDLINYDHFLDFRRNAAAGMYKFGDLFIRQLSSALQASEDEDAIKIIRTWQSEIIQCEMLQRIAKAKSDALDKLVKKNNDD